MVRATWRHQVGVSGVCLGCGCKNARLCVVWGVSGTSLGCVRPRL